MITRDRSGFIRLTEAKDTPVRVPTDDTATNRPIGHVPPEELEAAVRGLVCDAKSIGWEELRVRVARLFGWGRVGTDISDAIDDVITETIRSGALIEDGVYLRAA